MSVGTGVSSACASDGSHRVAGRNYSKKTRNTTMLLAAREYHVFLAPFGLDFFFFFWRGVTT